MIHMSKVALNIGCGPSYLPSTEEIKWVNTDIREDTNWEIDQHWDFTKEIPLPTESVDFILAWHILEHIDLQQRMGVLKDWYRVLKPGGKLAVAVPDILTIFDLYLAGHFTGDSWFIFMVNVYGPYNGSMGDFHRWGYCYDELVKVLKEAGFENIGRLDESTVPEEIRKFTLGEGLARKVVLAPWAAQILCIK